jgi:hypothetical protein
VASSSVSYSGLLQSVKPPHRTKSLQHKCSFLFQNVPPSDYKPERGRYICYWIQRLKKELSLNRENRILHSRMYVLRSFCEFGWNIPPSYPSDSRVYSESNIRDLFAYLLRRKLWRNKLLLSIALKYDQPVYRDLLSFGTNFGVGLYFN